MDDKFPRLIHGRNGPAPKGAKPEPSPAPPPKRVPARTLVELSGRVNIPVADLRATFAKAAQAAVASAPSVAGAINRVVAGEPALRVVALIEDAAVRLAVAEALIAVQADVGGCKEKT